MVFPQDLHEGRRLLVVLQVVQNAVDMQPDHLRAFTAPLADMQQKLTDRTAPLPPFPVQLQNHQRDEVLLLQNATHFQQLRPLVLRRHIQSLGDVSVEVGNAFEDAVRGVFCLDYFEDQCADYHGFEEGVEVHGRFDEEEGDEVFEALQFDVVAQDVAHQLLVVFDELVDLTRVVHTSGVFLTSEFKTLLQ